MVPGAKLEEISEADHWMVLNLADEVSSRILRFLGAPCGAEDAQ
jgi:hypothetical protein